jgi:hypothetical protein
MILIRENDHKPIILDIGKDSIKLKVNLPTEPWMRRFPVRKREKI